jgi:hypothetical protein
MERILGLNPQNKTAVWDDIKAKRNELEVSPIGFNGNLFDADRDSIMRITNAINTFAYLPTLDADNKIGWKTYDNLVVQLSVTDLMSLQTAITQRASLLFMNAELIKASGYLVKDLDNLSIWGL